MARALALAAAAPALAQFVQRVVALTPEQAADKRIERRTVAKEG